ncbi:hypothetical protein Prum_076150 [Phytohabitans rumicis]|uniref:Uncharacterized protein n=1 Tax=Phytohabitans rumicis TaxID=1076125 RepID=A0A6V8L9U4_9ACTN|nr:hypothetical protein Prum_076150 [Phytohabitans rumicis]
MRDVQRRRRPAKDKAGTVEVEPVAEVQVLAAPPVERLVEHADRPHLARTRGRVHRPVDEPRSGQIGEVVAVLLIEELPDVRPPAGLPQSRHGLVRIADVHCGQELVGVLGVRREPEDVPADRDRLARRPMRREVPAEAAGVQHHAAVDEHADFGAGVGDAGVAHPPGAETLVR